MIEGKAGRQETLRRRFLRLLLPRLRSPRQSIADAGWGHYQNNAFSESDGSLLDRWVEKPYWQYFCGFDTLQCDVPLHLTSLTKWRKRVVADKLAEMLQEAIAIAVKDTLVTPQELAQVNVDTTEQETNITHPTESKRYPTALVKLARAAKNRSVRLRQNYLRV